MPTEFNNHRLQSLQSTHRLETSLAGAGRMAKLTFSNKAAAAAFAEQFLEEYSKPAFGARSKTEIDNLVFQLLISARIVDPALSISRFWELNITLPRVRSLVFNWQLRTGELDSVLKSKLIEYFKTLRFYKDGTYVIIGIGDGLVREFFIAELQRLKVYPDRSHATEIVRVPVDGFVALLETLAGPTAEKVCASLVAAKVIPDTSVKGILKEVLVKAAGKIGEKAVGSIAEKAGDYLGDFIGSLFSGKSADATKAVKGIIEI